MHKYNKLLCTLLAVCMTASILSVSAAAVQPSPAVKTATSTTFKEVTPTTKVALNPDGTSDIISWPVNSNYGYWKIFLSNFSAGKTKIMITKDSPTGPQVGEMIVVPAGKRMAFYCDEKAPLESGVYYLSISTDGSHNFKGNLYYKFAGTYDALY